MSYCNQRISLIIPTLNAERYIGKLMDIICSQTVIPDEIIVIDSESDDATVECCRKYDLVKVIEMSRNDFDHGGTRNKAVLASSGDIILMLSQDVMPIHNDYVEKLIYPLLEDEKCAACSGRQIAYPEASLTEKLTREFNYKSQSFSWNKSDMNKLGIKTFFLSDCCAAYKKRAIESVGGYKEPCIANEDMILVSKILRAGYNIAYAADAEVFHSHDYSLKKQYKRNFDIGAGMDIDKEYFEGVKAESEGIKFAKYVLKRLIKQGHIIMAVYFCLNCIVRYIAHKDGKNWYRFSAKSIAKRTSNLSYWKITDI